MDQGNVGLGDCCEGRDDGGEVGPPIKRERIYTYTSIYIYARIRLYIYCCFPC